MTKVFPTQVEKLSSSEETLASTGRNENTHKNIGQITTLTQDHDMSNLGDQKEFAGVNHPQDENGGKIRSEAVKNIEISNDQEIKTSPQPLHGRCSETKKTIKDKIEITESSSESMTCAQSSCLEPFDEEKISHEEIALNRITTFKCIVLNEKIEYSWEEYILYPFCLVLLSFSSTIPLSLIPAHDLILYPEYWYESLFHGVLLSTWSFAYWCITAGMVLNITYILRKRNILWVSFIGNVTWFSIQAFAYYFWTHILEYQYPIPFLGFIMSFLMHIFSSAVIWFRLTISKINYGQIKRRMAFYLLFNIAIIIFCISYQQIITLVRTAAEENQPYVALVLPFIREFCIWFLTKLALNCPNGDERRTKIYVKYFVASNHTTTLFCVIGSYATEFTSWLLMGVDFFLNILLSLWIVWNKKRSPYRIHDQINALQNLVVYELVEFQALSFIFVIAVAFYGPNSSILGNISNNYWAFEAIENINKTLGKMGALFLVDFSSTLICSIMLWFCCRINLWKAVVALQKEFRIAFGITHGRLLLAVSNSFIQGYEL